MMYGFIASGQVLILGTGPIPLSEALKLNEPALMHTLVGSGSPTGSGSFYPPNSSNPFPSKWETWRDRPPLL